MLQEEEQENDEDGGEENKQESLVMVVVKWRLFLIVSWVITRHYGSTDTTWLNS